MSVTYIGSSGRPKAAATNCVMSRAIANQVNVALLSLDVIFEFSSYTHKTMKILNTIPRHESDTARLCTSCSDGIFGIDKKNAALVVAKRHLRGDEISVLYSR